MRGCSMKFWLLLTILLIVSKQNFNESPLRPKENIIKLLQYQTLTLSINSSLKIELKKNKTDVKPHSLSYISNLQSQKSNNQIGSEWSTIILISTIQGEAQYYFAPKNGYTSSNIEGNLKSQSQMFDKYNFIRGYLRLKQGVNQIKSNRLKPYLQQQIEGIKILKGSFCVVVIPKKQTKFIIKYGNPQHQILPLRVNQSLKIFQSKNDIQNKIYRLIIRQDSFAIKFTRKKGHPVIKLYQCQTKDPQCYKQVNKIPQKMIGQTDSLPKYKKSKQLKFAIESMLTKTQQYVGTKCKSCELYLSIKVKQQIQNQVNVVLLPSNYVLKLRQNEILKQDLRSKADKRYEIKIKQQEPVKISIQVYQGQINVIINSQEGDWSYSPIQSSGVISISIPISEKAYSKQKKDITYILQIKALQQDASYSLVYSSGQFQIFIKDGYPTSHLINRKQSISFVYQNQQVASNPMYLSFNLNDSKALNNLSLKVYYFQEIDDKFQKNEYKLTKSIEQLAKQAKSIVMQIPGNYPELEITFISSWSEPIQISVTINDQQIIFLPLDHVLPLQIDKNGGVNLLVDNNQEGFIELVIKKCDESYPKIAYSLSPQDFTNKIYDYESLQQNQRISKNNIKVKKGAGLYIRISGDGMTNSFIQISASYMDKSRKNILESQLIKKGNHGQINYQLITNSKAQIWFQQVECSEDCQHNTKYQCYWSTSRSDLFRHMICPGVFIFKNNVQESIKTQKYDIKVRPERDGIVGFKHILTDPVIYMSIKAISQKLDEIIYKDVQIVNISGQIGRMSTQFLLITLGTMIIVILILFFIIKRQARMGYIAIKTQKRKKKNKSNQVVI